MAMADGYRDEFDALLAKKKALEEELRSTSADLHSFRDRVEPPAAAEPPPAPPDPPPPEPAPPTDGDAEEIPKRLLDRCRSPAKKAALRDAWFVFRRQYGRKALAKLLASYEDPDTVIFEARVLKFNRRFRQITSGEDPPRLDVDPVFRGYIPGFGDSTPVEDWLYWTNLKFKALVRRHVGNRLARGILFTLIYGLPAWLLVLFFTMAWRADQRMDHVRASRWAWAILMYFPTAIVITQSLRAAGVTTRWIRERRSRRDDRAQDD